MAVPLKDRLIAAAFAFRGYNTTNLGRTPDLLAHPAYGPVVERHLREASEICAATSHRPVDLVERVRERRESTLSTFGEDIGLILSVELAQIELVETFFELHYARARVAFGYSLGEVAALVCGGVFRLADVLPPLVSMADECAELARDVTMGVVFSRGPALDLDAVQKLCLQINQEGRGVIGVSSILSPNTVLVLGQADTVDRFKQRMAEDLPGQVHLRKNNEHWPPLHTPLLWQRNVTNRAAQMMHVMRGGFQAPQPPVLSLVTGKASFNDHNSREMLLRWLDQPQRLWDVIYELLAMGIEVVIHVGPDPNLVPATFKRLSDNVSAQFGTRAINRLGMRAMQGIANRPWLTRLLSARVALLRAPFVTHVILEDWLLAQPTSA